jgi:plasmid stability protein
MAKNVQIRDVDDDTYRVLRNRAAAENLSLTAYLKRELERMASGPTMAEIFARSNRRHWGIDQDTIVQTIREIRDEE